MADEGGKPTERVDRVGRLLEALHDLTLADVERMSDGILKVANDLILIWHELTSQEQDKRALRRQPT